MNFMKAYLKELKFISKEKTCIKDITEDVKEALVKSEVKNGFVFVVSKHTTMGIIVQEVAEKNLLSDILNYSLESVPEDKRSTSVTKDYKYPVCQYRHRCQDNPYCDEVDEDYNAASHIRSLIFSQPSVVLTVRNGSLQLGKYQQVAVFEFDGRDGSGKNPVRQRTVEIWIYPVDSIKKLS